MLRRTRTVGFTGARDGPLTGDRESVRRSRSVRRQWSSGRIAPKVICLTRRPVSVLPGIRSGNGKTAIRGGYGIFFEHSNGNEANTEGMEGQTSPLLQTATQNNIAGYQNIGNRD